MKTEKQTFIFTKEQVKQFVNVLRDRNPIYENINNAKSLGFRNIPVPPTMPMIVYQSFDMPWSMEAPIIHRKQQCKIHQQMFIDEHYEGFVKLSDIRKRNDNTFSKQTLYLYDDTNTVCFSGTSHIVSSDIR